VVGGADVTCGVVTTTSVVDGASVIGGEVVAGDDEGTVVTTRGRLTVDRFTVVSVDEVVVGVVTLEPLLRLEAMTRAAMPTISAATTTVTVTRAQRGQPRNAHDPGGTAGGGPVGGGGAAGGTGGIRPVGSSIGMGCVGSSSSSVIRPIRR
jgi:uncharacterized membrane protein YgcG